MLHTFGRHIYSAIVTDLVALVTGSGLSLVFCVVIWPNH